MEDCGNMITSMEVITEVGGSSFFSMEVCCSFSFVEASMEVDRNFRCWWE